MITNLLMIAGTAFTFLEISPGAYNIIGTAADNDEAWFLAAQRLCPQGYEGIGAIEPIGDGKSHWQFRCWISEERARSEGRQNSK